MFVGCFGLQRDRLTRRESTTNRLKEGKTPPVVSESQRHTGQSMDSSSVLVFRDKDSGPNKWPHLALAVAQLHCSCKRTARYRRACQSELAK